MPLVMTLQEFKMGHKIKLSHGISEPFDRLTKAYIIPYEQTV